MISYLHVYKMYRPHLRVHTNLYPEEHFSDPTIHNHLKANLNHWSNCIKQILYDFNSASKIKIIILILILQQLLHFNKDNLNPIIFCKGFLIHLFCIHILDRSWKLMVVLRRPLIFE